MMIERTADQNGGSFALLPPGADYARCYGPGRRRVADLVQRFVPGRLGLSHVGLWVSSLQPHCDGSRTASELGITPRDLGVTLADIVQWLADQGHPPAARAPGSS